MWSKSMCALMFTNKFIFTCLCMPGILHIGLSSVYDIEIAIPPNFGINVVT